MEGSGGGDSWSLERGGWRGCSERAEFSTKDHRLHTLAAPFTCSVLPGPALVPGSGGLANVHRRPTSQGTGALQRRVGAWGNPLESKL